MTMSSCHQNRRWAQIFFFVVSLNSLWLCPYSKVEESFAIQATHDLFYHDLTTAFKEARKITWSLNASSSNRSSPLLPYDHLQYPGVVPRSFAGPIVLSSLCQIIRILILPLLDIAAYPNLIMILARLGQLTFTLQAWFRLANALDRKTGHQLMGNYLLIITAVQFHLVFYASRMLANSFATIVTLHAYSFWISGSVSAAAGCLVAATAIFRCDLLLLLFTAGLSWLACRQLTVGKALVVGITAGLGSLLLTVPIDSILWQRPVWPEGEVLYYNTILGKSSNWGVSAWHWYWTSALPKALLSTGILIPFSFLRIPENLVVMERRIRKLGPASLVPWWDTTWLPYLLPALGFVALYSALGHKEVRFLFPALPLFNLCAAAGMSRLYQASLQSAKDKTATWVGRLGYVGGIATLILSFLASGAFVAVSVSNYPGGDALHRLIQHIESLPPPSSDPSYSTGTSAGQISVYVDVASAMTGVSLFGQRAASITPRSAPRPWTFTKAGYEEEHQSASEDWALYTHILTENKDLAGDQFHVVDVAPGNPRWDLRRARIVTSDGIYVLERRDWSKLI